MKNNFPKLPLRRRKKAPEQKVDEALQGVPRITNDTVADHREEVLASARKYIYPLQHSKHRIVRTSIGLFVVVIVIFLAFCGLELYKFQTTSGFMHEVTTVLPFPVAKAGPRWVSYESYLFELRRNMHYYHSQQQANFGTKDGKVQLKRLKQQAMDQVVQAAYIKQLADQKGVKVSSKTVDAQVALVRDQNRLGNSHQVFDDVLNEFWGWDENDFKRELHSQLLKQAVVAKLDTATQTEAQSTLSQLQGGADFAMLATKLSDDLVTKAGGGQYPVALTPNDRNVSPVITSQLFQLPVNGISPVVNTGYTLEIIKALDANQKTRRAAHIQFNLADVGTYTKPLQAKEPVKQYIHF